MTVVIYVEGTSDQLAMEALFASLIEQKHYEGITIQFVQEPSGDKKKVLLTKVPVEAVHILWNNPDTHVVALPDLYPPNKGFDHRTYDELAAGIYACFNTELQRCRIYDSRLLSRFHVFCFKYDLEALVLASEQALLHELQMNHFTKAERCWTIPTEDQNHDHPPKRVVEALFAQHHRIYREAEIAPRVLGATNYWELADRCPQCFKPFVEFLTAL